MRPTTTETSDGASVPDRGAAGPALRRRRGLADEVRDLIARELVLNGAVEPGRLLPSEKQLSDRYGVSRITVRAALRSLQEAGLVSIRHGVGTTVLPASRSLTHGLDRLSSLETFARAVGRTVETADLEWEERAADDAIAAGLGVPAGHPVLEVRRVKLIGGARVAWMVDRIPAGVLPFETVRAEFHGSILDVLLAHDEVGVEYADCQIEPVNLSTALARRLGVRRGLAALFVDARSCTADGRAVEWAQSWLLREHFQFSVRRRRQIGQ